MLLLALSLLLLQAPPPDSTDMPPPQPSLRFYPAALYTPSSGVGVGVGVNVAPLLTHQGFVLLTAAPAQHTGRYTMTASTYDLDAARDGEPPDLYGALFGSYDVNGRQWYYGLGPTAPRAQQIQTVLREARAELRAGTYVTPTLMLQPHVGVWHSRLEALGPVPAGMDAASARNLILSASRNFTGHVLGVRAVFDTRDRTGLPRQGIQVQAELQRYRSWQDPPLSFDALRLWSYGYVPLGGRSVLALRAMVAAVFDRGDVPTPFYHLPEPGAFVPGIDDFRYYGQHMLALGAELRRPFVDAVGLLAVEGVLVAHVTSVYRDLPNQFSPRLSFEEDIEQDAARVPLRPILGAGIRLTSPLKDRVLVSLMLRYSPFGFGVGSLGFFHDLRALER